MDNDVQCEVDRSRRDLGLVERLRAVPLPEAERLYKEIEQRFSLRPGTRWIWEHLAPPSDSRHISQPAFIHLPVLCSSESSDVIFFPGSDGEDVCAYIGCIHDVTKVIGDCFGFEYIVVDPQFTWIVGENHHDVLFAAGEMAVGRLRLLSKL